MKQLKLTIILILSSILMTVFANAATKVQEAPALSIQLWSVKETLKKDFVGTLTKLSEMGFKGVEFAGYYGPFQENPEKLKRLLNKLGLTASGAHVGIDAFNSDVVHKNLLFFKTLGITNVIVPWDERAWHPKKVSQLTNQLTQIDQLVSRYGMQVGFHNHQHEFAQFNEATYWDYIAKNTPESVVLQLDVGWVRYADKNSEDYIKRYPGRTLTTHFKIRSRKGENVSPIIGDNDFSWDTLIDTVVSVGGAQWIVMEQEEYPDSLSELEAVARSKRGLDKYVERYLTK